MSSKKGAFKNLANFTKKKTLELESLFNNVTGIFIKKEIPTHMFSCKICKMF